MTLDVNAMYGAFPAALVLTIILGLITRAFVKKVFA